MGVLVVALAASLGAAAQQVSVDVDATPSGLTGSEIWPNFVSFSIEVPSALGMIGQDGSNAAFASLLEQLYSTTAGPHAGPNLRIGGNSADNTCFGVEGGNGPPGCPEYNFNETDLQAYRTFAETTAAAANVSYVIDTNFGLSANPSVVATRHIRGVTEAGLWLWVRGVEIGNEMDIYAGHANDPNKPHHRNASYNFDDYMAEYGAFASAYVEAGMPPGRLQGGTWAGTSWYKDAQRYLAAYGSQVATMSVHKYATSTCSGDVVTIRDLLAWRAAGGAVGSIAGVVASNSGPSDPPFVVGEGNSASCGGQSGVSDTFASALWAVDFLPSVSKTGVKAMNFHGGPRGPYAAVAFSPGLEVRPLFYGLMAFQELVSNRSRWAAATVEGADPPGSDPTCSRGIRGGVKGREVCCAASCGACGGTGCDKLPGGSSSCCGGAVWSANRSCSTHEAPCVPNTGYMAPVAAHAAVSKSDGTVRVLLVAKDIAARQASQVELCVRGASAASPAVVKGLVAPGGVASAKAGIRWGGLTWDNSKDGKPSGPPVEMKLLGEARGALGTCYTVVLSPLSALLLKAPLGGAAW